jgi:hypothetical protein
MAGLLHVSKWLRTVACAPGLRAPLPESAALRACGLTAASLHDVSAEVNHRLREVDSLLETKCELTIARELFPAHQLKAS